MMTRIAGLLWLGIAPLACAQSAADSGREQFAGHCAHCHGADGAGGERGPGILRGRRSRSRSRQDIRELIRAGIPAAGMPPFHLEPAAEELLVAFVWSLTAPAASVDVPGDPLAGEAFFWGKGKCGQCHMVKGRGGLTGPELSVLGQQRSVSEIRRALQTPGDGAATGYRAVAVELRGGRTLRGIARDESSYDLVVLDTAGRFHSLRRDQIAAVGEAPELRMPPLAASGTELTNLLAWLSRLTLPAHWMGEDRPVPRDEFRQGDWPTYNGQVGGNRHSPLDRITPANVRNLAPRWTFQIQGSERLEGTPVVVDGVMYVTSGNEVFTLDARTGRQIWHYRRPRTQGVIGDAAGGINRGVAIRGDRLFMVTDNAHLIALHRVTGGLLWDVEMADYRQHYGATSAPLAVNGVVISGVSGGDEGARGFVSAYKESTGEQVWRFWTVPLAGEPLSDTWRGRAIEHPCATTWLTGSFDPANGLVYWPTGNPCPDYNGDERKGDNLYSDSVLALEAATGKLRWYYQFTPHDLHDWDAAQTLVLVDADFQGRPRHLLLQANRNGFFYVLDRNSGELLKGTPFVNKLTWASGIGPDGRPQLLPGAEPTIEGARICPSVAGATNWMSPAFNPATGLFYVMAQEKCEIYTKSAAWWEQGKSFYGGGTREAPGDSPQKVLRAIDMQTGKKAWELPQAGSSRSWGGVLSTAGGLVFFGDDSGAFAAADAATGKPLWHFDTSQLWKASPMTYLVGGEQYVAVAAGSAIMAFGFPNP